MYVPATKATSPGSIGGTWNPEPRASEDVVGIVNVVGPHDGPHGDAVADADAGESLPPANTVPESARARPATVALVGAGKCRRTPSQDDQHRGKEDDDEYPITEEQVPVHGHPLLIHTARQSAPVREGTEDTIII